MRDDGPGHHRYVSVTERMPGPGALMCSERDYWTCHRERVAEGIRRLHPEVEIIHLGFDPEAEKTKDDPSRRPKPKEEEVNQLSLF